MMVCRSLNRLGPFLSTALAPGSGYTPWSDSSRRPGALPMWVASPGRTVSTTWSSSGTRGSRSFIRLDGARMTTTPKGRLASFCWRSMFASIVMKTSHASPTRFRSAPFLIPAQRGGQVVGQILVKQDAHWSAASCVRTRGPQSPSSSWNALGPILETRWVASPHGCRPQALKPRGDRPPTATPTVGTCGAMRAGRRASCSPSIVHLARCGSSAARERRYH